MKTSSHDGHYARCINAFIRDYLIELMDEHCFNAASAARFAGMSRSGLYKLLTQHRITRDAVAELKRSHRRDIA